MIYGNYRKASLYQAAMPLLKLATNVKVPDVMPVAKALSSQVPRILGKPEAVMMVQVDVGQTIIFGGSAEPAANVQLYSIGAVNPEVNVKVSAAVADIVSKHLQVSKTRYFLQIFDVDENFFGMHGTTKPHIGPK